MPKAAPPTIYLVSCIPDAPEDEVLEWEPHETQASAGDDSCPQDQYYDCSEEAPESVSAPTESGHNPRRGDIPGSTTTAALFRMTASGPIISPSPENVLCRQKQPAEAMETNAIELNAMDTTKYGSYDVTVDLGEHQLPIQSNFPELLW